MEGMIDSHARIFGRDAVWEKQGAEAKAGNTGFEKIMIVCADAEETMRAIEMARKNPVYDVAFGYSPNDVLKVGMREWDQLGELLRDPYVKAVGDIGMDYFFYETIVPKVLQKELFIRQIDLANKLKKPAIIHMRMSAEDTRRYIKGHLQVPGIMHNYSGGYEKMEDFLDIGMYLSFSGGRISQPWDESTRRAVREVPLDRLLVESDTVLGVQTGEEESPGTGLIDQVLDHICSLRGMEKEVLIQAVHDNYMRLFSS